MLASAEFWVAVAFVIFWGVMFYYGVPGKMMSALDRRGKRIADELDEARRLRQEAEALLKEYEQKRGAAEREAAEIVSLARDEAERLAAEAQVKIADFVKRRTASAEAKIAQAETQATAEVFESNRIHRDLLERVLPGRQGVTRRGPSGPGAARR